MRALYHPPPPPPVLFSITVTILASSFVTRRRVHRPLKIWYGLHKDNKSTRNLSESSKRLWEHEFRILSLNRKVCGDAIPDSANFMNHNNYITDSQIILLSRPFHCPYSRLQPLVFTSNTWKLPLFRVLVWKAFLLTPHTLSEDLRGVDNAYNPHLNKRARQTEACVSLYLTAYMAVSRCKIIIQDQLSHFAQSTWEKRKRKLCYYRSQPTSFTPGTSYCP